MMMVHENPHSITMNHQHPTPPSSTSNSRNSSRSNSFRSKTTTGPSKEKKRRNNKDKDITIPPRSISVDFSSSSSPTSNSNKNRQTSNRKNNKVTLKSTSDEIRSTTQDLKNLLLSEPSLPNGQKPDFGNGNSVGNARKNTRSTQYKKSPSSPNATVRIPEIQSLPGGGKPNFGNPNAHSPPSSASFALSKASNRNIKLKASSASSSSFSTFESSKYAGSSFHSEPKAVTLPKPSFLSRK